MAIESIKNLDHLGLVMGACNELRVKEIIDDLIPVGRDANLTHGERVVAMILNGIGFHSQAMYLSPEFFENKPVDWLFGREIDPEYFNDDALGRTLDAIDKYGADIIFSRVSFEVCNQLGINKKFQHLDSSTMQLTGEYEDSTELVRFGRPKNGKSGVKQFLISLMVSNDSGIPLLAKAIPGDSSDKTHFRETLAKLKKSIKDSPEEIYHVADSALYTQKTIKDLAESEMLFVTRVPNQILETKSLKANSELEFTKLDDNYSYHELCSLFGGVKQRWILVLSQHAREKEAFTLHKAIRKERKELRKILKKLKARDFNCAEDAKQELEKIFKQFKFHEIKSQSIIEEGVRKKKYKIDSKAKLSKILVKPMLDSLGKFIVASNELSKQKLSAEEILSYYKDQSKVERGFRFLNDSLCMVESVFLKKESRIRALVTIMCLCLLVYSISERKIRKALKESEQFIPSQTKKPTQKPTMKRIYALFQCIHILYDKVGEQVTRKISNSNDLRKLILSLLGKHYSHFYQFDTMGCGM